MQAGDICLLAPDCSHEISWCEERDVLLNIILFPHSAERILQNTSWGDNALTAFFVNALYQAGGSRNYILLPKTEDIFPIQLLNRILREYFDPQSEDWLIEELSRSFLHCWRSAFHRLRRRYIFRRKFQWLARNWCCISRIIVQK